MLSEVFTASSFWSVSIAHTHLRYYTHNPKQSEANPYCRNIMDYESTAIKLQLEL